MHILFVQGSRKQAQLESRGRGVAGSRDWIQQRGTFGGRHSRPRGRKPRSHKKSAGIGPSRFSYLSTVDANATKTKCHKGIPPLKFMHLFY